MKRLQTYGTYGGQGQAEGRHCGIRIVERCRECRGRLVQSGEEFACVNCGVVARTERTTSQGEEIKTSHRPSHDDERLGSYMGTREEERSRASFNGQSTLGYVKRLSDHLGEDHQARNCSVLIGRVAERLSLPVTVKENAILLSRRILADMRKEGLHGRNMTTVPTISAYCLVSACRAGGVHRVSANTVREAHVELGHRVTKGMLLRLGTEARVPLGLPDTEGMLAAVVKGLQSSQSVAERLRNNGVDARAFFAWLTDASKAVASKLRGERSFSPRTMAAGSVYVASREFRPKVFTQAEVAETLGVAEFTVREFTCWARNEVRVAAPVFGPLKGGAP